MFTDSEGNCSKSRLLSAIGFMGLSAVFISAAIIYFFDTLISDSALSVISNKIELAAITLTPYMISAVVAAITAIGIVMLLPALRAVNPSEKILERLRGLRAGDLLSSVKVKKTHQLDAIALELNDAVDHIRRQITDLKLVNRAQWSALCRIRAAAQVNNSREVLQEVEQMEKNWERIAAIEAELNT